MNMKPSKHFIRTIEAIDQDGKPRLIHESQVMAHITDFSGRTTIQPYGNGWEWMCDGIELDKISDQEYQSDFPPLSLRLRE